MNNGHLLGRQSRTIVARKRSMSDEQYFTSLNTFLKALNLANEKSMNCELNHERYSKEFIQLLVALKFSLLKYNVILGRLDDYFDSFLAKLASTLTLQDKYYQLISTNTGIKTLRKHINFCERYNSLKTNDFTSSNGIIVEKFYQDLINFGGIDKKFGYETSIQVKLQQIFRTIKAL